MKSTTYYLINFLTNLTIPLCLYKSFYVAESLSSGSSNSFNEEISRIMRNRQKLRYEMAGRTTGSSESTCRVKGISIKKRLRSLILKLPTHSGNKCSNIFRIFNKWKLVRNRFCALQIPILC